MVGFSCSLVIASSAVCPLRVCDGRCSINIITVSNRIIIIIIIIIITIIGSSCSSNHNYKLVATVVTMFLCRQPKCCSEHKLAHSHSLLSLIDTHLRS